MKQALNNSEIHDVFIHDSFVGESVGMDTKVMVKTPTKNVNVTKLDSDARC